MSWPWCARGPARCRPSHGASSRRSGAAGGRLPRLAQCGGKRRRRRVGGGRGRLRRPTHAGGSADLNGIWQTLNSASWDIRPHNASDGVPAGLGVVDGDEIPTRNGRPNSNSRTPPTGCRTIRCASATCPACRASPTCRSPSGSCRRPITSSSRTSTSMRSASSIPTQRPPPAERFLDGRLTRALGGGTLVVDTTHINGLTWFDAAGNFHSNQLHVVERYTPIARRTSATK